MTQKSQSVTGTLKGDNLDAFLALQTQEGLTQSATLVRIVEDWRNLSAKAPAPSRYAVVSPERFNLALGEVSKLSRCIAGAQNALRSPRPVLPEDEILWRDQWSKASEAFTSVDATVVGLIETTKLLKTPPPDKALATQLGRWSYAWTGGRTKLYRELLLMVLRPWTGPIEPPTPLAPAIPKPTSSETPSQ